MGRIARLEQEVSDLKKALATLRFTSDAPEVTVQVPVPVLDSNGNPTGSFTAGYLNIKTGPASGVIQLEKDGALLRVK